MHAHHHYNSANSSPFSKDIRFRKYKSIVPEPIPTKELFVKTESLQLRNYKKADKFDTFRQERNLEDLNSAQTSRP